MASMGWGLAAALLALLFCATGADAMAADGAGGPAGVAASATVETALDPAADVGKSKAGALCLSYETFKPADIANEIDTPAYRALLAETLAQANLPPAATHRVSGLIDTATADICWPNVGFGNTDKIKGTVSLSVSWQISNPETGAVLATVVTSGEHRQPKSGPGGLKGMLRQAFAANIQELASAPSFRLALANPATGGASIAKRAARDTAAPRVAATNAAGPAPVAPATAPTTAPTTPAQTGKKAAIANAVRLELGRKVAGRFDDTSYRSLVLRNRSAYYVLPAKKGQTVVMGLDCDFRVHYSCFYAGVMVENSRFLELADAPSQKAFRVTLKQDNPILEVWSAGDVEYALVVHADAAGDALWAQVKAERASYDQAVARGKAERSAERAQLFGAVLQGLAQGTAEASYEQQQAQATQDAMLADLQRQTMQIQQAQAQAHTEAQAQARTDAPRPPTEARRTDTRATPSATSDTAPSPVVASSPSAPKAPPSASRQAPARTAHVSCVIRDAVEKKTYYSQIENLEFPLDRVARQNAAYFKAFVVANHGARADITFLHCDYSFNDRPSLERQQSTNKAIDGRTGFATVQTSWTPQPVE